MALVVVDGLAGLFTLPRLEDPELSPRAGLITTRFPGASASRVDALVTMVLEEELAELDELKVIRATSRAGLSTIIIEVRDDLKDFVSAWSRVRQAIRDAESRLPPGSELPEFERREARAFACLVAVVWSGEEPPNSAVLGRTTRELEDVLRRLPGTEKVESFGLPQEEIEVLLDPADLAAYRLTPGAIARAISEHDVKVSSGRLRTSEVDLLLELPELKNLEDLSRVLISADQDARTIPLGQLSTLRRGEALPPREKVLIGGARSCVVGVKVVSSQRLDLWSGTLTAELEAFKQGLPQGVDLVLLFNQSDFTQERLSQLQLSLLLGACLVALTVLVTLGWRASIAISAALPLTTLFVLAGMKALGVPIHQISITGLIIALGLLIDNAIVVTDEVQHRISQGTPSEKALEGAVTYLFGPLTSSTLTTVLAFMPLVLMPGPAGEFVGSISTTVILALLGSLFLSLTIIPLIYSLLAKRGQGGENSTPTPTPTSGLSRVLSLGIRWSWGTELLARFLKSSLRHPFLGIGFGLILPLAGYLVSSQLPEQFFPPSDRPQCELTVELPPGASLDKTEALVERINALLLQSPKVERLDWYLGRSTPPFYYNLLGNRVAAPNYAQAMVVLDANLGSDLYAVQRQLQNTLDESFPEGRILLRQLEQGPPFEAPVEIRLYGWDLEVLRDLGQQIRLLLSQVPEITHTLASLDEDVVTLGYQSDEVSLRTTGLSGRSLSEFLAGSTEGIIAGSILEDTEQISVRVRLDDAFRAELSSLRSLEPMPSVTVAQLGELELRSEPGVITRRNKRRLNTVQGFVQSGVLPSKALENFRDLLKDSDFELPPGYELAYGGEAAERDQAVGNLLASAGLLGVLMVATLVLGFSSFRLAALIASVAAASVGLSLGAIWLFGYPFGFMAIVGAIGLVGIAINDSIVVIAALEDDPKARAGELDRMVEVVIGCTRHVFTTTLTTMAGFTPLLLNGGSFWPPLAVAVAGGVVGATILALVYVPTVYRLLKRLPSFGG